MQFNLDHGQVQTPGADRGVGERVVGGITIAAKIIYQPSPLINRGVAQNRKKKSYGDVF